MIYFVMFIKNEVNLIIINLGMDSFGAVIL